MELIDLKFGQIDLLKMWDSIEALNIIHDKFADNIITE